MMSVVQELYRVERQLVPVEIAEIAAAEADVILGNLRAFESIVDKVRLPRSANEGVRVDIAALTGRQIDVLHSEAPTITSVLDGMVMRDEVGNPFGFFPGFFSINSAMPGQVVAKHRDDGGAGEDCRAEVLGLRGKGDVIFENPITREEIVLEGLGTGDQYSFDNPADMNLRMPHYAITTGDGERLSLAYQLSLDRLALGQVS